MGVFSNLNEFVLLLLFYPSACRSVCAHGQQLLVCSRSLCEMEVTPARKGCGYSQCCWLGREPQDRRVPRELFLCACSEAEKLQSTTTAVGLGV